MPLLIDLMALKWEHYCADHRLLLIGALYKEVSFDYHA